eukprot:1847328-Karenia_brevis.AAC.1
MEMKDAVLARCVPESPDRDRAWKLLLFMDRLVYARVPNKSRPRVVTATQFRKQTVVERIRLFWRGDWSALWDGADMHAGSPMDIDENEDAGWKK